MLVFVLDVEEASDRGDKSSQTAEHAARSTWRWTMMN